MRPADVRFAARLPQIAVLFAVFATYSAARVPIPGVNEPHYLTKARHYWQPEWCRGDLFLDSANPHAVFYLTIGWLAAAFDFDTAARLGRGIAFLLLAIGWDRCVSHFVTGRWGTPAAAALFLLFQATGNFAGEWVVGGVESKVFSYAFALWSAGELLAGRLLIGGALLGAGISFHPVIGAWCAVCLVGAAVLKSWGRFRTLRIRPDETPADMSEPRGLVRRMISAMRGHRAKSAEYDAPSSPVTRTERAIGLFDRRFAIAAAAALLFSLPGLLPAAGMLVGTDAATSLRADLIQVGIRLAHHLDPLTFPPAAYRYYALLIALWLILRTRAASTPALKWLERFTIVALLVAVAGGMAAVGPRPITRLPGLSWRLPLLKLYPFRLADVAVPFVLAVTAVRASADSLASAPSFGRRLLASSGCAAALIASLFWPGPDRNPSRMRPDVRADWIAALRWVARTTPRGSLLWTPEENWAVKWYAERPEYVNYKDCPQDARGILEWYRRRVELAAWNREAYADGRYSPGELQSLHEQTGITHVIVRRLGPITASPVYSNRSFRVYEIGPPPR